MTATLKKDLLRRRQRSVNQRRNPKTSGELMLKSFNAVTSPSRIYGSLKEKTRGIPASTEKRQHANLFPVRNHPHDPQTLGAVPYPLRLQ